METPKKLYKRDVKNLPPHALVQKSGEHYYVYFTYSFHRNGKQLQERDYIGTVDPETRSFVPNKYFLLEKPVFENRPPKRWKDPIKRAQAMEKLKLKKVPKKPAVEETPGESYTRIVGPSAVAAAILEKSHLLEDVHVALGGNLEDTINLVNLGICSALSAKPTYLAKFTSQIQKFYGKGCLSSQRASEFFSRIGANLDLSIKLSNLRAARLNEGQLLSLDGTKINSQSKKIPLTALGKHKDGTFGTQLSFSLLANATEGEAIGYRYHSGYTADISTLEDFREIWNCQGMAGKRPIIVMDRGYGGAEALAKLNRDGYRFLVGLKVNNARVKDVIRDRNCEFYSVTTLLPNDNCYAIHTRATLKGGGMSVPVELYTYRNPMKEMEESRKFLGVLTEFESKWRKGNCDYESPLLQYFKCMVQRKWDGNPRSWASKINFFQAL